MNQQYTIVRADTTERRCTTASHLQAAELYARRYYPHPFVHVRRLSGEPKQDGQFQAHHSGTPVGQPFTVKER